MRNYIWGTQELFAIEIGNYLPATSSGKFRLWLNGSTFGDFKKSHKLVYASNSIKSLASSKSDLWEKDFEGKDEKEIFSMLAMLDKGVEEFTKEDYNKIERYQKYSPFFGDQFDNISSVIYIKDRIAHFIWSLNDDFNSTKINLLDNLKYSLVPMKDIERVSAEFLNEMSAIKS